MIVDSFDRKHTYLRISLIDKCNMRCTYCMPHENMKFLPQKKLMSASEIFELAKAFVELGVTKIRLTGGEPLLRQDFNSILDRLSSLNTKLSVTTNGFFVDRHIDSLVKSDVGVNLSIDTLDEKLFNSITGRNYFEKVKQNINLLLKNEVPLKLNMVLIKGLNEHEILPFVELTLKYNVDCRFIEFMPFKDNQWDYSKTISEKEILEKISKSYNCEKLNDAIDSTSHNYKIVDSKGSFGIISTITEPFCSGCNRIRITADGKLKNCLFDQKEKDILSVLRNGGDLTLFIKEAFINKAFSRGGLVDFKEYSAQKEYQKNRPMISIGG